MYNLAMYMKRFFACLSGTYFFTFALPITSWLDVADKCIEQGGKKRAVISDRESKMGERDLMQIAKIQKRLNYMLKLFGLEFWLFQ